MQYSDQLGRSITRHHNASKLAKPVADTFTAVNESQLSKLNWGATNNQHSIHHTGMPHMKPADVAIFWNGQYDPNHAFYGVTEHSEI